MDDHVKQLGIVAGVGAAIGVGLALGLGLRIVATGALLGIGAGAALALAATLKPRELSGAQASVISAEPQPQLALH